MNIFIITNGVPNLVSEQANADPIIFAKFLKAKKHNVRIISIFNDEYFSSEKKMLFYKKNFKKNHNLILHTIKFKKKNVYINKLKNIFHYNYSLPFDAKLVENKISKISNTYRPDIIINFFDPIISFLSKRYLKKKIKIINYLGVERVGLEKLIIKNRTKNIVNFIRNIFSLIQIKRVPFFYKKILDYSDLNLCPARDTYEYLKKNKIKNIFLTKPLSQSRKNNIKFDSKKNNFFMIGNLRSTFMTDSLLDLNNKLLKKLKKNYNEFRFKIIIVGKFKPSHIFQNLINCKFINFLNWQPDVKKFFFTNKYLLCNNNIILAPRTKILEAMSAGMCVFTYRKNIYSHKEFKNFKNIVCGDSPNDLINKIKIVLKNKKLANKISKQAVKTYQKYYTSEKIMNINYKQIKRIYEKI